MIIEIKKETYNHTLDVLSDIREKITDEMRKENDFTVQIALDNLYIKIDDMIEDYMKNRNNEENIPFY